LNEKTGTQFWPMTIQTVQTISWWYCLEKAHVLYHKFPIETRMAVWTVRASNIFGRIVCIVKMRYNYNPNTVTKWYG
jgi:hypothetical protein